MLHPGCMIISTLGRGKQRSKKDFLERSVFDGPRGWETQLLSTKLEYGLTSWFEFLSLFIEFSIILVEIHIITLQIFTTAGIAVINQSSVNKSTFCIRSIKYRIRAKRQFCSGSVWTCWMITWYPSVNWESLKISKFVRQAIIITFF